MIAPEKLLEIAESEGGKEARKSCDSQCGISIRLDNPNWRIIYNVDTDDGRQTLIDLLVDSKTGEIQ